MRLEKAVNKRILGYQSILGFYHWVKVLNSIYTQKSNLSFSDRIWCAKHGFSLSERNLYGRDELKKNYKDYLSARDYYKLFPINKEYSFWIDDKLTLKNVFSYYDEILPKYYYQLDQRRIFKLADCPEILSGDFDGIIQLIKEKKLVACKRLWGSGGVGFIRLEYHDGDFFVTGKRVSEKDLFALLRSLHSHLIMEYVVNCDVIHNIWPDATNTLRVLAANCDGELVIMRSFIRFGNNKSHGVDNAHSGGIESIIDENSGKILFTQIQDQNGRPTRITNHPDSGVSFDINIPGWDRIITKIKEICFHYPQLRYWGFDIAVTDQDGDFKILEINSHSGLMAAQCKEPLLHDPKTRAVYKYFGLNI